MDIGELKNIREDLGISREEMADKLGIQIDTLNTWEYRKKVIPKKSIERIKYVFGTYFNQGFDLTKEDLLKSIDAENLNLLDNIDKEVLIKYIEVKEEEFKKLESYNVFLDLRISENVKLELVRLLKDDN